MKILTFGKHKNEMLENTPESYIRWLAAHRNVLSPEHRTFSDAAKDILQRRALAAKVDAQIAEMVAAPKQTYRIITVPGPKKERFDLVGHITASRELKSDLLGEINEIKAKARRQRYADLGMRGNLSSNQGFHLLR